EVLAVVEGNRPEEKELHERFCHLHQVGEWFEPGDDLLAFVVQEAHPWDGQDDATKRVSEHVRLSVLTDDEIRLAVRLAATKADVTPSQLVNDILRQALADEIRDAKKYLPRKKKEGDPE